MELNVTLSVLMLLPVALALVAGGFILYRKSKQAGWRAAGMGSLALGVGALLVITLTLPVFQSSEGEAPGTRSVEEVFDHRARAKLARGEHLTRHSTRRPSG